MDSSEKSSGSIQVQLDWMSQYRPPEALKPEAETEDEDNKDGLEASITEEPAPALPQVTNSLELPGQWISLHTLIKPIGEKSLRAGVKETPFMSSVCNQM